MFELVFLGTSGGTPTVERGMPAIAVRYWGQLFLFDCGEGTQRQLMRYKVGYGSIDGIFISHPHLDHYLGLFGLLETLRLSSPSPRPLQLFVPDELGDFERYSSFLRAQRIKLGILFKDKDISISSFRVKHCKNAFGFVIKESDKIKFHEAKAHALGLKGKMFSEIQKKGKVSTPLGIVHIEDVTWTKPGRKIVYSGDCAPSDSLIEVSAGADLLVHEATFDTLKAEEAKERFHSTSEDAAQIAKKANVKKLILTHFSPRYSDLDLPTLLQQAHQIFPNTDLAYDGIKISF